MIKVLVNGACGRMGSEVVRTLEVEKDLQLIAAVDPQHAGGNLGMLTRTNYKDIPIYKNLNEALTICVPDVVIDFTTPSIIKESAKTVISKGIHMIIGTTGLTVEDREELSNMVDITGSHVLIAPNFSLGAVLLIKVSAEIAKYMPNTEIIELHHNHKYDAPSGTAKLTAEKIAEARILTAEKDNTKESLIGARGGKYHDITIHSVRLPGYVAHQEVLFGGHGETLTIKHDSLDRKSFMPGVMLAVKNIFKHPGLVYGLENYLE
ncbi:4-hydroxy-tetrahydrodipicolinate reductase [Dialister pneumosintes]|jgi:dihydrodipicolinate reductase|uniref:4-hydroxy-tetrahydrodipicolinate reductase n=1 Tax=Dialister pneumosintes TaxID=39950 RepID=A0A1B3WDA6_9FIRM|nr:4-hydroxy-tetrahydrodipicolinate reductase [Dialister pneumosintes]AOH38956.1 4-hydroxy-tetrahydrodipicolinate reductase [Dialister pneumosintes]